MSGISQGMGRKNAEMGKAHFGVLKMGKVRRLFIRMLFFLVVWLRTFVYSLPDTFKTLSATTATIVEHFRVFFLRDNM